MGMTGRLYEHISPGHRHIADRIRLAVNKFDKLGTRVGSDERNKVRNISFGDLRLNVKSFKIAHPVNRFVYRYLRKSKARRSYEHACYLVKRGIGTPLPVAYYEERGLWGLGRSYFVSMQVREDLSFRTLIERPDYPGREEILRKFTRFTHNLHENRVNFLDHSPGNTLISNEGQGNYIFFLVDLNRMKTGRELGFEARMKNFARLSATPDMIKVMAGEYSVITGHDRDRVIDRMEHYTRKTRELRARRKRMLKKLSRPGLLFILFSIITLI